MVFSYFSNLLKACTFGVRFYYGNLIFSTIRLFIVKLKIKAPLPDKIPGHIVYPIIFIACRNIKRKDSQKSANISLKFFTFRNFHLKVSSTFLCCWHVYLPQHSLVPYMNYSSVFLLHFCFHMSDEVLVTTMKWCRVYKSPVFPSPNVMSQNSRHHSVLTDILPYIHTLYYERTCSLLI